MNRSGIYFSPPTPAIKPDTDDFAPAGDGRSLLARIAEWVNVPCPECCRPAQRETERGTYNPTYLYYALGRMQILKLREDYRAHVESLGREFSLREFHDRVLRLGLPVALARRVMIPGDERPSL